MIRKNPINRQRIRQITGSFAFIEHRFLQDGFWGSLSHYELLLYLFLVIAADRIGLSYYSYDKICAILGISVDEYILARNLLIDKDLIAFDGTLFQVLSLPEAAGTSSEALKTSAQMQKHDPATVRQLITKSLGGHHD